MAFLMAVATAMVAKAQTERKMTVDELFQLVESNSKTLRQEKISVEFAKKGIEAARSARLPELTASASVSMNGDVVMMDRDFTNAQGFAAPRWGNSLALEAQQVVYAGGAIDAGIALATLQHQQAQVGEQQRRQQQRFLALGQYLEIFKLNNREQVVRQNIDLTQRLINDIQAKHEQGMALKNDVTRYELQMETLRLNLKKLQDQRGILNHQLCNQLGIDGEIIPSLTTDLSSEEEGNEMSWQNVALATAPSIQKAEIGQKMASQQLRLAKSEMRPKVAMVAANNFNGPFYLRYTAHRQEFQLLVCGSGCQVPHQLAVQTEQEGAAGPYSYPSGRAVVHSSSRTTEQPGAAGLHLLSASIYRVGNTAEERTTGWAELSGGQRPLLVAVGTHHRYD